MLFKKNVCKNCGYKYDSLENVCPYCGAKNELEDNNSISKKTVKLSWLRQIILYFIGSTGLTLVSTFFQVICVLFSGELELDIVGLSFSVFATYITVLFLILFVSKGKKRKIFASFTKYENLLFGIVSGLILTLFSYSYSFLSEAFLEAIGHEIVANENQLHLIEIIANQPYLSLIIIGFVGPLVEEITYRVGLFTLLTRTKRWIAFLATSLVFGFIHFSIQGDIFVEMLNFPCYVISGLILCYTYDKYSLAGSFISHAINNTTSTILIIIGLNYGI